MKQPTPRARGPFRRAGMIWGGTMVALAALVVAGCTSPGSPETNTIAASSLSAPAELTLTEGDVVRVSFPGSPELDSAQRIRSDGMLSLPMVGDIKASGRSLDQLQRDLRPRYASNLRNTEVIVTLDQTSSAIYVSGAVNKPGKYVLDRPMTVLEAVMEAGGFGPTASPKRVSIIRREGGQQRTQVVDLSPALRNQPSTAFYVRPYDVIYVQQSIL